MLIRVKQRGSRAGTRRAELATDVWRSIAMSTLIMFFSEYNSSYGNSVYKDKLIGNNSKSIGKEILGYTKSTVLNPIDRDDIQDCILAYVSNENIDGTSSTSFSNLTATLNRYDESIGDIEKAEDYDIIQRKIGLLFNSFRDYMKKNGDIIATRKNETDNFHTEEENSDGEPVDKKPGTVDSRYLQEEVDFNKNIVMHPHITRDIYKLFFEGERLILAKDQLTRTYNLYLFMDSINLRELQTVDTLIDKNNGLLDDKDLDRIPDLIDETFKENFIKEGQLNSVSELRRDLFDLELEESADKQHKMNILSRFFSLLVKSGIVLKLKGNEYFNNLEAFKYGTVSDIESFVQIMDSTKLSIAECPDFPILKGIELEDIIVEPGERHTKDGFLSSISRGLDSQELVVSDKKDNEMPPTLRAFLKDIIKEGEYVAGSGDNTITTVDEIVEGINRETIQKRDVELAKSLLKEEKTTTETFSSSISPYRGFFDMIIGRTNSTINIERKPALVKQEMKSILLRPFNSNREGEVSNMDKYINLWFLIERASSYLLTLETQDSDIGRRMREGIQEFSNLRSGIETYDLDGYHIPRINHSTNVQSNFNGYSLMFYGCREIRMRISNPQLCDRATLYISGAVLEVTPQGVKPQNQDRSLDLMEKGRSLEQQLQELSGSSSKLLTDNPMQFLYKNRKPNTKAKLKDSPTLIQKEIAGVGEQERRDTKKRYEIERVEKFTEEDMDDAIGLMEDLEGMF